MRSPVSLALCCVPSTSIFPHGPDGEICYGERLPAQTERTDIYAPADTHIKRGESRMEFFRLADSWLNLIPWRTDQTSALEVLSDPESAVANC